MGDDWFYSRPLPPNHPPPPPGPPPPTQPPATQSRAATPTRRPTTRAPRRGRGCAARRLRRLRDFPPRRFSRRLRPRARPRPTPVGPKDDGTSRLRRLLAGSGAGPVGGSAPLAGAHHVDSRALG